MEEEKRGGGWCGRARCHYETSTVWRRNGMMPHQSTTTTSEDDFPAASIAYALHPAMTTSSVRSDPHDVRIHLSPTERFPFTQQSHPSGRPTSLLSWNRLQFPNSSTTEPDVPFSNQRTTQTCPSLIRPFSFRWSSTLHYIPTEDRLTSSFAFRPLERPFPTPSIALTPLPTYAITSPLFVW